LSTVENVPEYHLEKVNCLLCNSDKNKILGIRGNHEYYGADKSAEPHIYTNVAECITCGFIFTNPMIYGMEHLETSHYDNPEVYQSDEKGDIPAMFERRLTYISSFSPGKKLLDIGAGKGEFLNTAKKLRWDVSGVEPSPRFCRYAKETFNIDLKQGFLDTETFAGRHFDLITLNHVLEHVDKPYQLLDLISLYLDKSGILFIEVPNVNSTLLHIADIYFRLKGLKWSSRLSPLHPPYHKYGYSEKSLRYLLNKAGFKVLGVKTYPEAERGGVRNKIVMRQVRNIISSVLNVFDRGELISIVARKIT
jgi:SAM-dependent methyltransferase